MTLPTDPTPPGGGGSGLEPRALRPHGELAGIRELLSLMRELIDRLEDRIDHLTDGKH